MMLFKTKAEQDEIQQLKAKNEKLFDLLMVITTFVEAKYRKDITITEIFRSPEEQKALYAQTPNPPTESPHMYWRAADIRTLNVLNSAEIAEISEFVNKYFPRPDKRPTALFHKIAGNVEHFHIQYS